MYSIELANSYRISCRYGYEKQAAFSMTQSHSKKA